MKPLMLIGCLFIIAVITEITTANQQHVSATTAGVSQADVHSCIETNNMMSKNDPDVAKKIPCFLACLYKSNKVMANDKVDMARANQIISENFKGSLQEPNELKNLVEKCGSEANKENDGCKCAVTFTRCMTVAGEDPV